MPNNQPPTVRTLIWLMLVVILAWWRFVFNASILFTANFASAYARVGGRFSWLKYLVEQGVIGLKEILGVFVIRQCILLSPLAPLRGELIRPQFLVLTKHDRLTARLFHSQLKERATVAKSP